jgi:rsbT co-antagonist protein RsbR
MPMGVIAASSPFERRIRLAVFYLLSAIGMLLVVTVAATAWLTPTFWGCVAGCAISIALTLAYWRGWEPARYVLVASLVLVVVGTLDEPFLTQQLSLAIFVPPALAMILGGSGWVAGTAIVTYGGLLLRAGMASPYAESSVLLIYVLVIGSVVVGRILADRMGSLARQEAARAHDAAHLAEERALEVDATNRLLREQLETQQRLLSLVDVLETPTVTLSNAILLAPIVGPVDTRRLDRLSSRLLEVVHTNRIETLLLDVSGVPMLAPENAQELVRMLQSLQLLGCRPVVCGVSSEMAMALSSMDIGLGGIDTIRSPQDLLNGFDRRGPEHRN